MCRCREGGQLAGWGWLDAVHPSDREETRRAWSEAVEARGVYVVDRGSTNGSRVTGMSGVSKRCAPGDPVQVEPGSIVSFGDHWLEVRRG